MTYEPKFWNGYRADDVKAAYEDNTIPGLDFKTVSHMYYRFFNDGDTPHHATFQRLCKKAYMIRGNWQRDEAETLDELVEALLDRVPV